MSENGIKTQISKPMSNVILGAAKNNIQLARTGITTSLKINFKPSAIACNVPQKPVTLGPLRRWIDANTLRSAIVKKAIANSTHKKVIKSSTIINKKILNK